MTPPTVTDDHRQRAERMFGSAFDVEDLAQMLASHEAQLASEVTRRHREELVRMIQEPPMGGALAHMVQRYSEEQCRQLDREITGEEEGETKVEIRMISDADLVRGAQEVS
ncbi:hypothetical protein LCGC14_3074950, partial [marine sediment metagenome]